MERSSPLKVQGPFKEPGDEWNFLNRLYTITYLPSRVVITLLVGSWSPVI